MKLSLILLLAGFSTITSASCLKDSSVCVGDKVVITNNGLNYSEQTGSVYEINENTNLLKIKTVGGQLEWIIPGNGQYERNIMKVAPEGTCEEFKNTEFCVGDDVLVGESNWKILTMVRKNDQLQMVFMNEKANRLIIKYFLDSITVAKGAVKGFTNLNYGESIENAYGSQDIIRGMDMSDYEADEYVVYLGETNKTLNMRKKELEFRLSNVTSVPVSKIDVVEVGTDSRKKSTNLKSLKEQVISDQEEDCKNTFWGMGELDPSSIKLSLENYKLNISDDGKWASANYKFEANCRHK